MSRATARFIAEVGYSPLLTTGDVVTMDGNSTNVLLLPMAPVVAVSSVVVTSPGAVPVSTSLVAGIDYQFSPRLGALLMLGYGGWPFGFGNIVVTFDHGWLQANMPDDIADAILEQAEGIYRNRAGVKRSDMGPQQVQWDGVGKTQRWSECVARLQRNRVSPA